jgi:hypothetical protein
MSWSLGWRGLGLRNPAWQAWSGFRCVTVTGSLVTNELGRDLVILDEKLSRRRIGELLAVDNIDRPRGQEAGDQLDDAHAVGTAQGQVDLALGHDLASTPTRWY